MIRNISASEKENVELMPGAGPFLFEAGDVGCLLIHGISGSAQVFRAMGERLAAAGITAHGVLLAGHGTKISDLHNYTYDDWLSSAEKGLSRLAKRCRLIFVAGLSMGGVISLCLAALHPDQVQGLITICAPYRLSKIKFRLVPVAKYFIRSVRGGLPSINDPEAHEVNYQYHSLPAVHQLIKLTGLVRLDLPLIRQPVLVVGARQDRTVTPDDAEQIYRELGSQEKELLWLDNSQHIAPLDYDRVLLTEAIIGFIKSHGS